MKKIILLLLIFFCKDFIIYSQVPSYVPLSGLMGYWPFTGNANDQSGNGNNGTVNGASLTSDRFSNSNQAYSFNGSSDYISTNYAGVLGTNPRAVSFWARTAQSTSIMTGVSWGANGTASRFESGFNYGAPGPMLDGGNGVITYSSNPNFYDNNWHHFVTQFGSSSALNLVQIYEDGILLTTTVSVYNGTNILNTISSPSVTFGRIPFSPFHYFNGDLDDIGIWNRSLTLCEIHQLYTGSLPTTMSTNSVSVCPAETVTLNTTVTGSYTWMPGSLTGSAVVLSPPISVIYTVTGLVNSCPASSTFSVLVKPSPTITTAVSRTLMCVGENNVITAYGASTYLWNNSISGSTISLTAANAIAYVYTVTGTGSNGCVNTTTVLVEANKCTSIDESGGYNSDFVSIYPNPSSGNFIILLNYVLDFTIVNEVGQIVKVFKGSETESKEVKVKGLAPGVYILNGLSNELNVTKKIIVLE